MVPIRAKKQVLRDYLLTLKDGTEFSVESLPNLNKFICGFERKKLIVIGGRPSEGKSAFAMQLAYDFSKKFKVLYISLEMTEQEMMFRTLCRSKKIDNTLLYGGVIPSDIVGDYYDLIDQEKRGFIGVEEIGRDWGEVSNMVERLSEDKPDIIFMDYIQCIRSGGRKMEAIEDYIRSFRALAVHEDMCVFVLSQINRMNVSDNKEPSMDGLKGAGFLEEHADKVLLVHYPCKSNHDLSTDDFKVIIAKNRNGMTGYVKMKFTPQHYNFYEEDMGETVEQVESKFGGKVTHWQE